MILDRRIVCLFGILVIFLISTVTCESTTSKSRKLEKLSRKKIKTFEAQFSRKYLKRKENELTKNGSRNEVDVNHSEELKSTKHQNEHPPKVFRSKDFILHDEVNKMYDNKNRGSINIVKRNATSPNSEYRQSNFPKNYKKLKFSETRVRSKDSRNEKPLLKVKTSMNPSKDKTEFKNTNQTKMISKRNAVITSENVRANSSDYLAQRRAVMEKFYARQREIARKYGKPLTGPKKPLLTNNLKFDLNPNNVTMRILEKNNVEEGNHSKNISSNEVQSYGTTSTRKSDEKLQETTPINNYMILVKEDSNDAIVRKNDERAASGYYPVSSTCENQPLSGSISPKKRSKKVCRDVASTTAKPTGRGSDDQEWGECEGSLVYQHNLLLGLNGTSNLDAIFEVIIQGPVCITCVEAIRYNETRAIVTLDSGGQGFNFAKLKLKGFENEGFSYIIKIWGVKKTGERC